MTSSSKPSSHPQPSQPPPSLFQPSPTPRKTTIRTSIHHNFSLPSCILTLYFLLLSISPSLSLDPVVNVALGKLITADLTCGFAGPERFISQKYTGSQTSQNVQTCFNTSSYPASNIVDGNEGTWWQSTSRLSFIQRGNGVNGKADAVIEVNLNQTFEVQSVSILFGESLRPGRMIFYKATDANPTYQMWFFVVTSTLDCQTYFNVPLLLQPNSVQSTPCIAYQAAAAINQRIDFPFNNIDPTLKPWVNLNKVKVEFYQIDLTLGVTAGSNDFQHYTVRSLEVQAKCPCNGQLTDCAVDNTTNEHVCICGGFTTGKFCEQCLPLYNNQLYAYGTPCQMCNCNNHSTSCHYDASLASGVCDNCQNFTAGPKCESCIDNYYKTPVDGTCIPCSCSGSYMAPGGGCYKTLNDTRPAGNPNPNPGDCYCKPFIIGSKCDRCQDGAYALSENGCTDCACLVNGTVGGSKLCNDSGQCSCKINVGGLHCDVCKDGFYNLDANNPDGCSACGCDVGGAVSATCDKVSGQCVCKNGVVGKLCSDTAPGFFFTDLQFLNAEVESLDAPWQKATPGFSGFGYVLPISQIPVSTNIDLTSISSGINSDTYRLLLRCMASAPITGILGVGQNNVISNTMNMTIPVISAWQYVPIGDVKLTKGAVSKVTITIPTVPVGAIVNLDRMVAVPIEYYNTTSLLGPQRDSTFQSTCMPPANADLSIPNPDCSKALFSLSTYYFNGAQACNCDFMGSANLTYCNPAGGSCTCKAGVAGRRCDKCDVNFSNLGAAGCTACNCTTTTYNMCDPKSGSCLCPPGSQGDHCQTCMLNYYNWNELNGCQPCSCNSLGSSSLSCNISSGACACKSGVTGLKCDQCMDGFWQMSVMGCSSCNCDVGGSVNPVCDKGTGACVCKANVQGQQCTECKINSFSMSPSLTDGCLSCLCMGVTTVCSPSYYIPINIGSTPDPSTLTVANGNGDSSPPPPSVYLGMANMSVPAQSNLFWRDPKLSGNLLSFYGALISYQVMYSGTTLTTPPIQKPEIVLVSNKGTSTSFQLLNYNNSVPPANTPLQMNTNLTLENVVNPAPGLNRGKLLVYLSDVKAVLFPATFSTSAHQSTIGNVMYQIQPNLVEKCSCPTGYEGSSCEACSLGYFRDSLVASDYLGTCIPCSCNGMSSTCDLVSGQCSNCQQNTAGSKCELCLPGFYRMPPATSGACMKCPCEGPRVNSTDCTITNNTVMCTNCSYGYQGNICDSCRPDYYGNLANNLMGLCKPCTCNGFSTTCDQNGICLNCTNSTAGNDCEKCIDGKFKDNVTSLCVDCTCNSTGSISNLTCDLTTGQCACKYGIGGRMCDTCLPNFYNYSVNGCQPCNCNQLGSASLQCQGNGSCLCKNDTEGFKCDACSKGAFGILIGMPCQKCGCDPNGAYNSTEGQASCDVMTGQCNCTLNVVGRTCDSCAPMYYTAPEIKDCKGCDTCTTSLGNDVIAMVASTAANISPHSTELSQLQQLNVQLATDQIILDGYCYQLGSCADGNNSYYKFKNDLYNQLNVTAVTTDNKIKDLITTANSLNQTASQLNSDTSQEMMRLKGVKDGCDVMNYASNKLNSDLDANIKTLQGQNQSSINILANSPYNITSAYNFAATLPSMFANQSSQLAALLRRNDDLTRQANDILSALLVMESTTSSIKTNIASSQLLSSSTDNNITNLNNTIKEIDSQLLGFQTTILDLVALKTKANDQFKAYNDVVQATETLLNIARTSLNNCLLTFTECVNIMRGPWTVQPQISIDSGFSSWDTGINTVNMILMTINSTINNTQSGILSAEQKADALTAQAASISSSFDQVKGKGQPQVDVINKLMGVIATLQGALDNAKTMNSTLQDSLRYLNAASLTDLQTRANNSLTSANTQKGQLDDLISNNTDTVLSKNLDDANVSFQTSVNLWSTVDTSLNNFSSAYTDLTTFITNITPTLNANYQTGMNQVQVDNTIISNLDAANKALRASTDALTNSIANLNRDVTNAYVDTTTLQANLTSFKTKLDQVRTFSINSTMTSQNSVNASRPTLDSRFANLDSLMTQIQSKLSSLEQPVFFLPNTYEQVSNPDINMNDLYNSIGLDFMFPKQKRGVLLYIENTLTLEKLLLQILNSTVCFEYSNTDVKTMVCNYAQLVAGSWYRVYASRYEIGVKLTVILLSTGGAVTVSTTSASTSNLVVTLNSPIYVGGLPLNAANINKVYDNGVGFNGCIYRVQYNGATMPLWQSILRKDSTASCCKKPPSEPQPATISPCVTAYGTGYIAYNPAAANAFTVSSSSSVSIQFRTFAQSGVLFLVSSMATNDYMSVFLQNGKIVFGVSSQMIDYLVKTDSTYNNGSWFKFTAVYTPSSLSLTIELVNSTSPTTPEVKSTSLNNINLTSLNGAVYIVGGQNGTFLRGPVTQSFSGSLKEFQHSTASSSALVPHAWSADVLTNAGIDLTKCLDKVQSGLGFTSSSSYCALTPGLVPLGTMDFTFITTALSGILFYAPLEKTPTDSNTFLYICLYNGDIFIIFNQGQGRQPIFRTRDLFLSDGVMHKISLDFRFVNSPRMKVDNTEALVGALNMNANMKLQDNLVYIGGVPPSLGLDSSYIPVKQSFVGGFKEVTFNPNNAPSYQPVLIQFNDPTYLLSDQCKSTYFGGIQNPLDPVSPPCNPCPSTQTVSTLKCVAPTATAAAASTNSPQFSGYSFGDSTESYLAYGIVGDENVFVQGFVTQLKFKALQPDGLLLYMANQPTAPLTDYFAVYMSKGYLNAILMNSNSLKSVTSKKTYYDGDWHLVTIVRVNNFLAILLEDSGDYNNNNNDPSNLNNSTMISNLFISSPIYMGGVPLALNTYPSTIPVGKLNFKGCIGNLVIQSYNYKTITYTDGQISSRSGVTQCTTAAQLGMSLSTSTSYIQVSDSYNPSPVYNLVPGFSITLTFKAATTSGVLAVAWDSPSKFVSVSLVNGEIQVILSSQGTPFIFTSHAFKTPYDICNNAYHTVTMTINVGGVSLSIDSMYQDSKNFDPSFSYAAPLSVPIYLGGVKELSWNIPNIFSGTSLIGCIQRCFVNNNPIYITQSTKIQGVVNGCI